MNWECKLVFVIKKKLIYHSKEKPFLLTNSVELGSMIHV